MAIKDEFLQVFDIMYLEELWKKKFYFLVKRYMKKL